MLHQGREYLFKTKKMSVLRFPVPDKYRLYIRRNIDGGR